MPKERPKSLIPEYKYLPEKPIRALFNKPDLRFDVADINQKKSKYAHIHKPDEKEVKAVGFFHELYKLDSYQPALRPIE